MRREAVGNGEVKLEYCLSMEMIADTLTKPLEPQRFKNLNGIFSLTVSFDETM